MAEPDIYELIGQLKKSVRTEDEEESLFIVLRAFFNYLLPENPAEISNLFEKFLINFNKLKGLIKNAPQRIELKASKETDYKFRNLLIDLMLDDQRISNLGDSLNEKIITVPTGFEAARNEFNNYRVVISRVGHRIIRSCLEKVNKLAVENNIEIPTWFYEFLKEEKFYGFEPDFWWLYQNLQDSIDIYDKDDGMRDPYEHAKKSLEFLEEKVIGSSLSTLHRRWKEVPHVLMPRHVVVKNPDILLKLYDEAVRTYVAGNNLACIAMCRSLFERILIDYYGAPSKDEEGKGNKLWKIISWSEKRYNSLRDLNLPDKTIKANEIVHEYNGTNIEGKTALSYIKTIKSLIEKIPAI